MSTAEALLFARVVLVALFAVSAASKLTAFARFEATVRDFDLVPRRFVRAAAAAAVLVEIAVAVTLATGLLTVGFLLAIVTLCAFSVALVSALARHLDVPCGCFGHQHRDASWSDVARNALMIAIAGTGVWLAAEGSRGVATDDAVLIGAMSLVFTVLVINLRGVADALLHPL
jgi:hypothetical protein